MQSLRPQMLVMKITANFAFSGKFHYFDWMLPALLCHTICLASDWYDWISNSAQHCSPVVQQGWDQGRNFPLVYPNSIRIFPDPQMQCFRTMNAMFRRKWGKRENGNFFFRLGPGGLNWHLPMSFMVERSLGYPKSNFLIGFRPLIFHPLAASLFGLTVWGHRPHGPKVGASCRHCPSRFPSILR